MNLQKHNQECVTFKEPQREKNDCHTEGDLDDDNAKIFPQRLMEVLSDESNNDSITWLPNGKSFVIVNRLKFSNEVLPKYFKKTKWTSFTRKLNRWNFTRINKGPQLGAYYHEFFQRDNEALCTQMYCKNDRAKFAVSQEQTLGQTSGQSFQSPAGIRGTAMGGGMQSSALPPNAMNSLMMQPTGTNMHVNPRTQSTTAQTNKPDFDNQLQDINLAQTRLLLAASQQKKNQQQGMPNYMMQAADPKTKAIMESAYLALQHNKLLELMKRQQQNTGASNVKGAGSPSPFLPSNIRYPNQSSRSPNGARRASAA